MPQFIQRDEVQRLLAEEDAQLVDVLPPREYGEKHVRGAINIPLKQLSVQALAALDRSRPVIVYCHDTQ